MTAPLGGGSIPASEKVSDGVLKMFGFVQRDVLSADTCIVDYSRPKQQLWVLFECNGDMQGACIARFGVLCASILVCKHGLASTTFSHAFLFSKRVA